MRLGTAERIGARAIESRFEGRRERYPITVDASADAAGLALAIASAEPGGTSTSVDIYDDNATPILLLDAYRNGRTFITGRVDSRPVLPDAIATIARGRLAPELATTRSAAWGDAPDALLDAGPKVVVAR